MLPASALSFNLLPSSAFYNISACASSSNIFPRLFSIFLQSYNYFSPSGLNSSLIPLSLIVVRFPESFFPCPSFQWTLERNSIYCFLQIIFYPWVSPLSYFSSFILFIYYPLLLPWPLLLFIFELFNDILIFIMHAPYLNTTAPLASTLPHMLLASTKESAGNTSDQCGDITHEARYHVWWMVDIYTLLYVPYPFAS